MRDIMERLAERHALEDDLKAKGFEADGGMAMGSDEFDIFVYWPGDEKLLAILNSKSDVERFIATGGREPVECLRIDPAP